MPPLVRSASLTNFSEVARECGLDARALVREVGLPVGCLTDPDMRIPARPIARLLELAARRAGEPAFALRMVQSRRLSNLGPLGLLLRDQPTLRSAIEVMIRHVHVHNESLTCSLEEVGHWVVLRHEVLGAGAQPLRQAHELILGVTLHNLEFMMGAQQRPRLVCFTHSAPASLAVHRQVFDTALAFDHDYNGIVFSRSSIDSPNPAADPVMSRYAKRLLDLDAGEERKLTEKVRELIVHQLARGGCRVEVVAQHLGMDRRSVARRLAAEGSSYSELLEGVRADLVPRLLESRSTPLREVSLLLGFSSQSAFSRWHRQRFGAEARSRRQPRPAAASKAMR